MSKNRNKENVNWMKIKWIRVTKNHTNVIFYKNSFEDDHFKEIDIGRKFDTKCVVVRKKFTDILPIAVLKKNDLVKLCKDRVIPIDHHSFYNNLKTIATKPDFIDCSGSDTE